MIKAGIFDIGGVLLDWSNQSIFDLMHERWGISQDTILNAWERNIHPFSKGEITEDEFLRRFYHDADVTAEPAQNSVILEAFIKNFRINEKVLAVALQMKANGYKIGLLSDTIDPHLDYLRFVKLPEAFDIGIFSNEVGYEKPSAEIYRLAIEQLDVKPEEAFFVDNLPPNAEGANKVGIHGIVFETADKLINDIKELGVKI